VFDLATLLDPWMFPYILLHVAGCVRAGALNTFGRLRFGSHPGAAERIDDRAHRAGGGRMCILPSCPGHRVLLGGVLQLAIQVPRWHASDAATMVGLRTSLVDPQVRRVLRQMGPPCSRFRSHR